MSSSTIYARVQDSAKQAVDEYASRHGRTMSSAVQELLGLGLTAAADKKFLTPNADELELMRQKLREREIELQKEQSVRKELEREMNSLKKAADLWAERADISVANCSHCNAEITGSDLLILGRCSNCQKSTSTLFSQSKASDSNTLDLMLVLGAVGVLLGLLITSESSH